MAHPYCPFFEVPSVCNNRGRLNLAAGWGWGCEWTPRPFRALVPLLRVGIQIPLQKSQGVGDGDKGENRKGGHEAEPSSHILKALRPPRLWPFRRSPLHPINGNSPHFLLWRFGLVSCLGPASARTCAQGGACRAGPRISRASQDVGLRGAQIFSLLRAPKCQSRHPRWGAQTPVSLLGDTLGVMPSNVGPLSPHLPPPHHCQRRPSSLLGLGFGKFLGAPR